MRPSLVAKALDVCIAAKQPVMIKGSPGVGKSRVVEQAADRYGGSFIDLRLSQLDPVDLRGIPVSNEGMTDWLAPKFLPREGKGVLFLDEINSAAQATQAAAYQLILDRKLGDYTLPDAWALVAAGNRMSDRAIVNQMSTALRNRFVHIEFDVNVDDWCDWALRNKVHVSVLGFIRFRPMLLNEFEMRNKSKEERDRVNNLKDVDAFATPRSWEFLSKIMDNSPPEGIELELYRGVVGEGPAAEFIAYLKYYRQLPDLDQVLKDPMGIKVPTEPAVMFALATGLATKATPENMPNFVKFALRMPPEFQVLMMKDAVVRDKKLTQTKQFNEWATKNQAVLL